MDINKFIKDKYQTMTDMEIAKRVGISPDAVCSRRRRMGLVRELKEIPIEDEMEADHSKQVEKKEQRTLKQKYGHALDELEKLRAQMEAVFALKGKVNTFQIEPHHGQAGESVAISLASDWHIEEEVKPDAVSGVNFYNLEESKRRATEYFRILLHLIQLEQKNVTIKHLILGLLGDFISGDIHEDVLRSTLLEPTQAICRCQDYLVSGIEYLLKNSTLKITAVCHTGNHGRKGHEQLIANEAGSSLEYLMYHTMQTYFKDEPRIQFLIPEGYHSYVEAFGKVIRLHHGHNIRYGGGVGGMTIPVNKAIAQWNKTKTADIDCFGHFHTFFDGGNFIANGSLIGFNAYALSIKASFEPPKQALFFIHSRLGHYDTRRILFPR